MDVETSSNARGRGDYLRQTSTRHYLAKNVSPRMVLRTSAHARDFGFTSPAVIHMCNAALLLSRLRTRLGLDPTYVRTYVLAE